MEGSSSVSVAAVIFILSVPCPQTDCNSSRWILIRFCFLLDIIVLFVGDN